MCGAPLPYRVRQGYNVLVMAHRAGDCSLVILQEPDVALQLTCTDAGAWRSMIFEFASKKVVFTDETSGRLPDLQQRLLAKLTQIYGVTPREVKWRNSVTTAGDGPSG